MDLGHLARSQLAFFADLIDKRIELRGPPLFVSASAAQTMGMALHELATNAGKYGALSNEDGVVDLAWSIERKEGGEETFVLSWHEHAGPAVQRPSRRGFGSTVIHDIVEISLHAQVELDFPVTGLSWRLECPAEVVVASERPVGTAALTSSNPCVLVVEDEALVALEIAHVLTGAGFDVLGPARAVAQALELLGQAGCDAAVLDINLGTETSEPVALELSKRRTPFVTLSGYRQDQHPPVFKSAPALAKPLRPEILIAELKRFVGSKDTGSDV